MVAEEWDVAEGIGIVDVVEYRLECAIWAECDEISS
jgi:hypothetical protein